MYYSSNNQQQQQYQNSLSNSFTLRYPSFDPNGFDQQQHQPQQQQQQYNNRNDDSHNINNSNNNSMHQFNGFQSVSCKKKKRSTTATAYIDLLILFN